MKIYYHGASSPFKEEDYMVVDQNVDLDALRKIVSADDYEALTSYRRGWYALEIHIECRDNYIRGGMFDTDHQVELFADSMLDAYNKRVKDMREGLHHTFEVKRVSRIDKCNINFLGVKTEGGYMLVDPLPELAQKHRPRIGLELKNARIEHGYTVEEVARRSGIMPQKLASIEDGVYDANIDLLIMIADCCGCELKVCEK